MMLVHYIDSEQQLPAFPPAVSAIFRTLHSSRCVDPKANEVEQGGLSPELSQSWTTDASLRLRDVFNLTLSTVGDVRALTRDYGPTRSALPFVLGLIRGLVHATDTPFARHCLVAPQHRLDGVAIVLASHIIHGVAQDSEFPERDCSSCAPDESNYCHSNPASNPPADSIPSSPDPDTETTSSYAGVPTINIPLEAHILPGHGRRHLYAALPFLCLADRANMFDLMYSLACQRYVWGISEPAVGLMLSENCVEATLVLSWMDCATHVVHLASTSEPHHVFDFTNTASALAFSQMLLHLAPNFDFSQNSFQNNPLDWRADNPKSYSWAHADSCLRDRITIWVEEVYDSSPPGELPLSESPLATRENVLDQITTEYPKNLSDAESAESEDLPWLWACDRGVHLVAAQTPLQLRDSMDEDARLEMREINQKVEAYDEMCRPRRSSSWANSPPVVDPALFDLRDSLLRKMTHAVSSNNRTVQVQDAEYGSEEEEEEETEIELRSEHRDFLEDRMSSVLLASAGSSARPELTDTDSVVGHHDWNRLLYIFYAHGQSTFPCISLEQAISLARNHLADRLTVDSAAVFDEACTHAGTALELAVNFAVGTKMNRKKAFEEATHALQAASSLREILDSRGQKYYHQLLEDRFRQEQPVGKCDAMLSFTVAEPLDRSDVELIRQNSLIQVNISNSTKHLRTQHCSGTGDIPLLHDPVVFPHVVVHYSRAPDTALDRARMSLVSVVMFYAALGIDDHAFYCLMTSGAVCKVYMAWKSSQRQATYLVERNIRSFDISVPMGAFQLAALLLRLRDDREALRARVLARLKVGQ
ncbi:hypothetical protein B0H16DRAFT_1694514 [Mycena metata]|uniref:Uncharacterized protein n=1 Tax=Mycena metata TaxID=1033252 RepID=A0AAD7MZA1_9AGAR|nr:hypothetical protein B0H16DRAFT_1694514 [Mycena metata]